MEKHKAGRIFWVLALIFTGIFSQAACINNGAEDQVEKPAPVETPASEVEIEPNAQAMDDALFEEPTPIPIPPTEVPDQDLPEKSVPVFDQFILDMITGEKDKVVGLWVEDKMALAVVYQPSGNAGFVSTIDEVATHFLLPYKMAGNYGMLAHNYLAGRYFFDVKLGDIVELVFGDGYYQSFEVVSIKEYQALQPNSPTSEFINQASGEHLTANDLFYEVYMGDFHTTMQTCIAQGLETEWGRIFLVAPPL